MSSVVRTVLGAALILTSASAAMAASDAPPAQEPVQTAAASDTAVAEGTVQTSTSTDAAAASSAPVLAQSSKPHSPLCDNSDEHGGHGASTRWGLRAYWDQAVKN